MTGLRTTQRISIRKHWLIPFIFCAAIVATWSVEFNTAHSSRATAQTPFQWYGAAPEAHPTKEEITQALHTATLELRARRQPLVVNEGRRSQPPIIATPAELGALNTGLLIPVQGVTPEDLRDTYAAKRGTRTHEAIDILAPRGTPVLSASAGRLLKLFNSRAGGKMVYATDESARFILLYGHLDRYATGLTEGMRLERGQVIGYVGTSGNAPPGTPHLHFGILRGRPYSSWSRGTAVNPYPLLMP